MSGSGGFWVDVPQVRAEADRLGRVIDKARSVKMEGLAQGVSLCLPGARDVTSVLEDFESHWGTALDRAVMAAQGLGSGLEESAAAYEAVDADRQAELERQASQLRDPGPLRVTADGRVLDARGGV